MLPGMTNADRKEQCERRVLALLEDSGLPLPDEVDHDYAEDEVMFLWSDRKVALIVELTDFEDIDASDGFVREGITA